MERIRAQMSNGDRIKRANAVIDTSGDMESTREQALKLWQELQVRLG
jgi:dephospho-CoA kinase